MANQRKDKIERLLQAGARWQSREVARTDSAARKAAGGAAAADSPERVRAYVEYRATTRRSPITTIERIIGAVDFKDFPPTPDAGIAARPVARIVTRTSLDHEPQGFGTGFMVAPGILMTNHHVLPTFADALVAGANFGHERTPQGVAKGRVIGFTSNEEDFVADEELDFAIVALQSDPGLAHHGLQGAIGKILVGQRMNIIQHPNGGPRKYAVDANELVDVLPDFLHYTTDTQPGSSGSPAFNSDWEVVALHHSGVPRLFNGQIMAKGNRVWDAGTMTDDDIDWVANEGVRVSRIVSRLKELRQQQPSLAPLIDRVLLPDGPQTEAGPAMNVSAGPAPAAQIPQPSGVGTVIHIHGSSVIYTGQAGPAKPVPTAEPVPAAKGIDSTEAISIDPDYSTRLGYSVDFLGTHAKLLLPTLDASLKSNVAPLHNGDAGGLLAYHHFSVVMHAQRRLAIYTAVNINGRAGKRPARETDKWIFDPRIATEFQCGEAIYASNPLDRGHLVRRLDPAWGTTAVAKVANDDTFHFTNCSPQHEKLNQRIWADLEDYLLDHAQDDDVRLSVFTGPMFQPDDPSYRGIQLPRRFWKVAVMRDGQGKLLAAGFVQSQRKLLAQLSEADFLSQETRTDQVKVKQIERLTGVRFQLPAEADALFGEPDVPIAEGIGLLGRSLSQLEDIKLR